MENEHYKMQEKLNAALEKNAKLRTVLEPYARYYDESLRHSTWLSDDDYVLLDKKTGSKRSLTVKQFRVAYDQWKEGRP